MPTALVSTHVFLSPLQEALTDKGLLKSDRPERKDEKDDRAGGNPAQRDSVSSTASAPRESDVIKRSTSNGKAAAANGKAGGAGVFSALSDGAWAKDWPILTQAFTITFLAEWGRCPGGEISISDVGYALAWCTDGAVMSRRHLVMLCSNFILPVL